MNTHTQPFTCTQGARSSCPSSTNWRKCCHYQVNRPAAPPLNVRAQTEVHSEMKSWSRHRTAPVLKNRLTKTTMQSFKLIGGAPDSFFTDPVNANDGRLMDYNNEKSPNRCRCRQKNQPKVHIEMPYHFKSGNHRQRRPRKSHLHAHSVPTNNRCYCVVRRPFNVVLITSKTSLNTAKLRRDKIPLEPRKRKRAHLMESGTQCRQAASLVGGVGHQITFIPWAHNIIPVHRQRSRRDVPWMPQIWHA